MVSTLSSNDDDGSDPWANIPCAGHRGEPVRGRATRVEPDRAGRRGICTDRSLLARALADRARRATTTTARACSKATSPSKRCVSAFATASPPSTRARTTRQSPPSALPARAHPPPPRRTSEAVLGKAFAAIAAEFPRSSYQIITKAGRYGRTMETGFDYSPAKIRSSIANSLKLFGTDYLDGVYMHDVEFVSERVGGVGEAGFLVGKDEQIAQGDLEKWGLGERSEGVIVGEGDQKVLDAMATLFELKKEGVIKAVGFSGKPFAAVSCASAHLLAQGTRCLRCSDSLDWSPFISSRSTSCNRTAITLSRIRLSRRSSLSSTPPASSKSSPPRPSTWACSVVSVAKRGIPRRPK